MYNVHSNNMINTDCGNCLILNKFDLKVVFQNNCNNSLVIYQSDGNNSNEYPSGMIIAQNLSISRSFTFVVAKGDGTTESYIVPPTSQISVDLTSIVNVSGYSNTGLLVGAKFCFNLIQPI